MPVRITAALLSLLLLSVSAFAQQQPDFSEQVAVSYVMIPFTALGPRGIPIKDLKAKDVSLFVDNQQVTSDMFEISQNAPVSFTILLDGSGSMGLAGKMDAARAAVSALLDQKKAGDDYALYVFAEGVAKELVPFTDDADAIRNAMWTVKPWGKTAFFDALAGMPAVSELGRNPTRAIILLSDGIDNASELTRQQIAGRLEGVPIPIYPLGLREPGELRLEKPAATNEELSDIGLLSALATMTGGKLFIGNRPEQVRSAVSGIEQDLRTQYLIGFSPTGKGAVKYRRISLRLAGRVRSVRVRAGYRGTEPPVLSASASRGAKGRRNERKGSR